MVFISAKLAINDKIFDVIHEWKFHLHYINSYIHLYYNAQYMSLWHTLSLFLSIENCNLFLQYMCSISYNLLFLIKNDCFVIESYLHLIFNYIVVHWFIYSFTYVFHNIHILQFSNVFLFVEIKNEYNVFHVWFKKIGKCVSQYGLTFCFIVNYIFYQIHAMYIS